MDGPFAEQTRQVLIELGAILVDDHFVYISGHHGSGWIDKDVIFPHTDRLESLCRNLATLVKDWSPEVVCGPAMGGMIIAEWLGHELGILSVYAEHDPTPTDHSLRGQFVLRRGYDHVVA